MNPGSLQQRIGQRVRTLRKNRGWTQQELAHRAKTSSSYLGQVERGQRDVGVSVLDRIATALGVSLGDVTHLPGSAETLDVGVLSPAARQVVDALVRELQQYEEARGRRAGELPLAAERSSE